MASVAEKILRADQKALLNKTEKGTPLTAAQRAVVQAEVSGADDVETYVKNLTDLAAVLGITRQQLNTWRKMSGAPGVDAGGRHNTAAWLKFRDASGLKGSETDGDLAAKKRFVDLKNEDLELDIAIKKGEYEEIAPLVEQLGKFGGDQKRMLIQKLEKEYPAKFPKEVQGIARELGRKLVDEVCRRTQLVIDDVVARAAKKKQGAVELVEGI